MWGSITSFLDGLYSKPTKLFYLSVFRVILSVVILEKALVSLPYLYLLYDNSTFEKWHRDKGFYIIPLDFVNQHYSVIYYLYIALAILMLLGYGRRLTVFLVYAFTDIIQHVNGFTLDGGDNLLKFLLLYLSLCDSFQYLTIRKESVRGPFLQQLSNIATNFGIYLIIGHLLLVYFKSGISKANSSVWYDGTALYYTLVNDRFCSGMWNRYLVQNAFFVIIGTYSTMIWEIIFPFLIWIKRLRIPLIIFGIILHLGIFFLMMIHEFELIFIGCFGFFFSDDEYRQLGEKCSIWSRNLISFLTPRNLVNAKE